MSPKPEADIIDYGARFPFMFSANCICEMHEGEHGPFFSCGGEWILGARENENRMHFS